MAVLISVVSVVMANFTCEPDRIWNSLEKGPLSKTVGNYFDSVHCCWEHFACGQGHRGS